MAGAVRRGGPGGRPGPGPGHLTALYLYTGDDHTLFKTYVAGSRFGEAVGRWMIRRLVWKYAREIGFGEDSDLPQLLKDDLDLSEAIDDLVDLGPDADGPAVAEVRRRVNQVADRLYADLAAHIDMAVEALEILPPLNGPVWWGGWASGRLADTPDDSPLITADTMFIPRFRSTTEYQFTAMEYMRDDEENVEDRHPMLAHVPHSTGRLVTPFSPWIDEDEVLYAPGSAVHIEARGIATDPETGREYADYTLREMPPYPPTAYRNADDEPSPRIVELGDGEDTDEAETAGEDTALGTREPAPRGAYRRTGPYAAELDGTVFALHESPGEGDRLADTLLFALRYAAPDALQDAGIDTSDDFRDWMGRNVTDDDLSQETPLPLDGGRMIPLKLLDEIGAEIKTPQRTEGVLLGDQLPASGVDLSPAKRFRLLLRDPSYGGENGPGALADVVPAMATRALGVELAMVGPDGQVTFHGGTSDDDTAADAPPALLVRDGDRYLAGLPDGPGDVGNTADQDQDQDPDPDQDTARLRRVAQAVSAAPDSVRHRLRDMTSTQARDGSRRAPDWIRARIRYLEEAERFERRLGLYLGDHEAANAQLGVMVRELWDRAVAAGRWRELGSDDPTIDGVVGTDRDRLEAVVESGNLRERLGMLYVAQETTSDLLGTPLPSASQIGDEYVHRLPSAAMTAFKELQERSDVLPSEQRARLAEMERTLRAPVRRDEVRPPLSDAERAMMPDEGIAWIPGMSRWDIAMGSPPQSTAEEKGGLARASISGTAYRQMRQAVAMRDRWGLDIDLGLLRLTLMAEMLPVGHHSLHEIMRGSQLVLDQLREDGTPESPDLDYIDNWGRYWRIAPLTEAELRTYVATDGKFPDEHALEATAWPTGIGPDGASDEQADPEVAAWLAAHRDTLEDVQDLLVALGPDAVLDADGGSPTPELLERLIDDWFRARGLEPTGSLDEKLRQILNARA
ncbi:hypothetical protein SAZ11_15415 [Streptomyces sp. FXJ1.4098]|nr:hypothetical protein [Streptomyces sp. FXJ1.4098]